MVAKEWGGGGVKGMEGTRGAPHSCEHQVSPTLRAALAFFVLFLRCYGDVTDVMVLLFIYIVFCSSISL